MSDVSGISAILAAMPFGAREVDDVAGSLALLPCLVASHSTRYFPVYEEL